MGKFIELVVNSIYTRGAKLLLFVVQSAGCCSLVSVPPPPFLFPTRLERKTEFHFNILPSYILT